MDLFDLDQVTFLGFVSLLVEDGTGDEVSSDHLLNFVIALLGYNLILDFYLFGQGFKGVGFILSQIR